MTASELDETLELFGLEPEDLDNRLPPAWIHAGASHIVLVLKDRSTLSVLSYSLDEGRQLMRRYGVVTIMLVFLEISFRRYSPQYRFESWRTGANVRGLKGLTA